jgi:hypothetical protein
MRISIVSMVLAGGMLALGACATPTTPLTLAERTEQCRGRDAATVPTGRETGDARQDYMCSSGFGRVAAAATYAGNGN